MNYRDFLKNNRKNYIRKISLTEALNEEIDRPQGDAAKLKFFNTIRDYFGLRTTSVNTNLTEVEPDVICALRKQEFGKDKLAVLPGFKCWVCYSNRLNKGPYAFDLDPDSKNVIIYSFKNPTTPLKIIKTDQSFETFMETHQVDHLYGLTTDLNSDRKFDIILDTIDNDEEEQ